MNINTTFPEYVAYLGGLKPVSQAVGAYTSAAVNVQLHNRLVAILSVGTIGSADSATLSFTQCATSGGSYTALTGLTAMAALTADNTQLIVDIPAEKINTLGFGPYVKGVVTIAGSNSCVFELLLLGTCERYGPASDNNVSSVTVVQNS